jgi:hypothetical protein
MRSWDPQFRDARITKVHGDDEQGWSVTMDDGWSIGIPQESPIRPAPGMTVRLYGEGIGRPVRGMLLDGVEVYYRTAEQQEAAEREWVENNHREKQAAALLAEPETARRIAALPEVMQRRLKKFRDTNPDFDWEYLPYELMCCEDGVKIADALRGEPDAVAALTAFHAAPWDTQIAQVPTLDRGHSGNSFGMACRLARWLLTEPEMAVKDHGALTPLVGCDKYGCPHDEVSP